MSAATGHVVGPTFTAFDRTPGLRVDIATDDTPKFVNVVTRSGDTTLRPVIGVDPDANLVVDATNL